MSSVYTLPFWSPNLAARDLASEVEVFVSLTRYRDLANNSDKWRRIFTVCDLKNIFRPYTFTQTGRWTSQTAAGIWSGGTVRTGKVVSNAAWNRAGKSHITLHRNEVARQRKDYSVTEADKHLPYGQVRDMLVRLPSPHNPSLHTALTNAASTPVQTRPHVLLAAQETENRLHVPSDSHLGNRIAQFLTRAMDTSVDPFDLFADMALLKQEFAEEQKRFEKMELDLKLANETLLQRAVE